GASNKENRGTVFVFPRIRISASGEPPPYVRSLLLTPLYQEAAEAFVGLLTLTVDLEELLMEQLAFVNTKMKLCQAWIMDRDGTLLFQSEHPEMALRNIYQRDEECNQCHTSFDYTEKMLTEKQGTVDYELKNFPRKLAAFASMEFENASWVVVVDALYEEVTAFVRKDLIETLLLLGVVVLALVGGSTFIYRSYRLKVRAEEEAKQFREKRVLEDKIRQSEERYRRLVELSPDAIAVHSEGKVVFINTAGAKLFGAESPEQLIGKPVMDFLHPDYWDIVEERIRQIREQAKEIPPIEEKFIRLDGTVVDVEVAAIPFPYQGKPAVQVVARDITERKQTEEAARKSEETARALLNATRETLLLIDTEGIILAINETGARRFNKSADELVGLYVFDLMPPHVSKLRKAQLEKIIRSGEPILYEDERAGKTFHNCIYPVLDKEGNVTRVAVFAEDITERKQAEAALWESQAELSAIFDNTPVVMALMDRERRVRKVNRATVEFTGRPVEEMIGLRAGEALRCLHSLDDPKGCGFGPFCEICPVRRTVLDTFETGNNHYQVEAKLPFDRGEKQEELNLLVSTTPLSVSESQMVLVCVEDITEHKQAEEALRESEEKYRNLIDQSHDAIYLLYEGKFEIINRRFEELFGYTQEETNAPEFNFMNLVASQSRALIEERVKKVERDEPVSPQYEFTALSRNGKEIEVETSVSYVKYKGGIATQGILRDITERKRLQEQLLQSEKMSALGQLISGVAHELNNPMTGVLGYAQLLLTSPDLPEKAKQSLEKINQEAERARKIVQNLLTFARQRKPEKRRVQINEIVGRTLELRAYEMKVSDIELIKDFGADIPSLLADEHQLQQVFMNIIINAEQAMLEAHGMGRLKVTTRWDGERDVVAISFQDDGPGIAEEYLSKVFDPFFTTKPVGKGTGLGLSISYGIVQEHGGRITAFSKEGCGATFTVELPVVEVQVSEIVATAQQGEEMAEVEKKRVLVVDDETSVVDLVRETLERE
ncbi:MAG: PAS domain S-box protein, partial [bacterium]